MKLMKDREVETKNKIGGYGNKKKFIFHLYVFIIKEIII